VKNGVEVSELLIRSQRIFSDITMFFQYRVPGCTSGSLCMILRDWIECPQDHEFRCYVHQRQLTAISQYHCYSYFSSLQDKSHILRIREAIQHYVGDVIDCFPMSSFVIDVAVQPQTYSCYIIELNPFGQTMSSGSALFNWDRDFDLLYGRLGRTIPCIRILHHLVDSQ